MKSVVYGLILLLCVLHQDFWNWQTHEPMLLGFIPIGLAWHAGISVCAGAVAFLAVKYCWPLEVDAPDESPRSDPYG